MRFIAFTHQGQRGLAVRAPEASTLTGLLETEAGYPGDLDTLIRQGRAALQHAADALRKARRAVIVKLSGHIHLGKLHAKLPLWIG